MKHIKKFTEDIELYPISIKNLQDPSLISEVKPRKIAIEKGENWGETRYGTNKKYYDIYWGPVEKDEDDCVSDYIFLEMNGLKKY